MMKNMGLRFTQMCHQMKDNVLLSEVKRMKFNRRQLLVGGATLGVGFGTLADLRARGASVGPVGKGSKAPELIGGPQDWLNTEGKALKLYGPGGLLSEKRICLIDFWEYTCVNCIRTLPYLRAWNDRYRDKGLVIIGIHTPEFAFARQKANVAAAVQKFKITYPVLNDAAYDNWSAFHNRYWPRKYLLDRNGRIVYDHAGEGNYGETEAEIQKLLRAADPKVQLPKPLEPLRGSDKPGAVCYPQTPEIYAGYARGDEQFGLGGGLKRGTEHDYVDRPTLRQDGLFYASGLWKSLPESLRHARSTDDPFEDYVALPYKALEANAVIKPEGDAPFDVYLLQDGQPIAKEDKGADVRYDAKGRSFVHVDRPRMYNLIANHKWGQHEIRLGSPSPDFGLYSFTFASCEVGGKS
jgi:thiol-disulfide isomerase/thioredoxin